MSANFTAALLMRPVYVVVVGMLDTLVGGSIAVVGLDLGGCIGRGGSAVVCGAMVSTSCDDSSGVFESTEEWLSHSC